MSLYLYNSLSRSKEIFIPLIKDTVSMYVCGPTVYDYPHLGNARSVVVYDMLYRLLLEHYGPNKVNYIRNITDVDDKIITSAIASNISIQAVTSKFLQIFHEDISALNCLPPSLEPKATEHIEDMIKLIESLITRSHAYIANNHVFFDITSFAGYGKLSGRTIEEMIPGSRVEIDQNKRHPGDFVLWKPANIVNSVELGYEAQGEKPTNSRRATSNDIGKSKSIYYNDDESSVFLSPWGKGRPGWHIECSAMSMKYLGHNFDIHGGGADLIFPHHTNEIAQSCCAFDNANYAKYWVHNGFLTVNGEKMSKSLGNFTTVRDLLDKGVKGEIIRYLLLSTHYRKPLDFNEKSLQDAHKSLDSFYRAILDISFNDENISTIDSHLHQALNDDLNTPEALSVLHNLVKNINKESDVEAKQNLMKLLKISANFMGLLMVNPSDWFKSSTDNKDIALIEKKILERAQAKIAKNWQLADEIREQLKQEGIILEDIPGGETLWRKL